MGAPVRVTQYACLNNMASFAQARCGRFDDYSFKHMGTLARLCENAVHPDVIMHHVMRACPQQ